MSKKQFTLDSWLKDKNQKVVTRCGFPVRIVCTDVKRKDYPILALVERDDQEEYQSFTKDGRFSLYNPLHDNFDLFIETADEVSEDEKIRKWCISHFKECINVIKDNDEYKEYLSNKVLAWLEKQGEKRPDPYNGISFEYNGHTWGMCARDNGVDILLDKQLFKHLEKQDEQKETNLVEILKHYPKETELYSPLYGKLWLAEVDEKNEIITCYKHHLEEGCTRAVLEQEDTVSFYSNGTTGLPDFNISKDCMLFLYDIEKQNGQDILEDAVLDGNEDGLIAETIRYKKEKQSEQNTNDKVEPKFKVGDKIRRKTPSSFDKDMQVARIEKDYYVCNHIGKFSSEVVPFSKQSSYELIEQNPAWSEEDECYMSECIGAIATKDGWSFDEKRKTKHWLKSLKDRVLLQPKQKWSEEEIEKAAQEWESKANFNPFYMTMENGKPTGVKQHITTHKESFIAGVNWILKSLNS